MACIDCIIFTIHKINSFNTIVFLYNLSQLFKYCAQFNVSEEGRRYRNTEHGTKALTAFN